MKPLLSVFRRPLPLLVLGAVLLSACLGRGTRGAGALFTLTDPRGDDHGDGELRYPLRDDMPPGSLDLLSLAAFPEEDGTRFEATFARPIARPPGRTVDLAGETLSQRARHGFYTFNLDLYVDTDRAQGSGRTETLPGRYLTLAPSGGWEKAILVAPRPIEARDTLRSLWRKQAREEHLRTQGSLSDSQQKAVDAQVEQDLAQRVFFPTRMRVTGATV
ncbi:MAG TPA: glucodextranase DOMON-like domain-containing protein, partial [Myxococcaceae bacterium]